DLHSTKVRFLRNQALPWAGWNADLPPRRLKARAEEETELLPDRKDRLYVTGFPRLRTGRSHEIVSQMSSVHARCKPAPRTRRFTGCGLELPLEHCHFGRVDRSPPNERRSLGAVRRAQDLGASAVSTERRQGRDAAPQAPGGPDVRNALAARDD